jgi:hypothetical protein
MPRDITIDMKGLPDVKRLCAELPGRSIRKGYHRAFNLGARPMLKTMKKLASKKTGLLRKSQKIKQKTHSNGNAFCIIGPDRNVSAPKPPTTRGPHKGQARKHRPAFISHLVDKGHGGPHPAPAHEFRQPAFDQNKSGTESIIHQVLIETLQSEAQKLGNNR